MLVSLKLSATYKLLKRTTKSIKALCSTYVYTHHYNALATPRSGAIRWKWPPRMLRIWCQAIPLSRVRSHLLEQERCNLVDVRRIARRVVASGVLAQLLTLVGRKVLAHAVGERIRYDRVGTTLHLCAEKTDASDAFEDYTL